VLDLGYVGAPAAVNPKVLEIFKSSDIIPVVAPIGIGPEGETYNINADTVAGAIAAAVKAARLYLLTDVAGVLDRAGELVPDMTLSRARALIADGTIRDGMIPKIETCVAAVESGVDAAVILDGRLMHVLLLEIFTATGVGTLLARD
jgi:acetylglutamate kinase